MIDDATLPPDVPMPTEPGYLEATLRAHREAGRKILVPYITGGYPGWQDAIRAAAAHGADAVEIGIPFSDPVMDGPVIQQASQAALDLGTTPPSVLAEVPGLDVQIPLIVMTYYNLVHHDGHRRFAHRLVDAGISGCILPDLPLEESGHWTRAADYEGVETIMLAAPTAPDERLPRVVARLSWLSVRSWPARRHGGARHAGRNGDRTRGSSQGHHRQAGARGRGCFKRTAGV